MSDVGTVTLRAPDPRRCDDCGQTKVCARVYLLDVTMFLCDPCLRELGPVEDVRVKVPLRTVVQRRRT